MKKIFIFRVIVIGLAMSISILGCGNGTLEDNYDATLVCFGDSLTAGYGATTPGSDDATKSYPAYLQGRINMPVINAGKSGDTTYLALSRINNDVLSKNPKIVIIELGANDLFTRVPPQTTKDNMQSIINLLAKENRKIYIAKFYTETVARSMTSKFGITDFAAQTQIISQYDDMFSSIASINNIELIEDIWSGVWGIHMSDIVHPNAAGYEIMANNYFNVIKFYLEENNLLK
jgi:acyl-CoA thioesterase-1